METPNNYENNTTKHLNSFEHGLSPEVVAKLIVKLEEVLDFYRKEQKTADPDREIHCGNMIADVTDALTHIKNNKMTLALSDIAALERYIDELMEQEKNQKEKTAKCPLNEEDKKYFSIIKDCKNLLKDINWNEKEWLDKK